MTEINNTLAADAMQAAEELAKFWRLGPDEVCDAISLAWQGAQLGHGSAGSIAWFAIKRIRNNRRFRESVRSIDSPKRRLTRSPIDPADLVEPSNNPAATAMLRIDFEEWLASLPDRPRQIAVALASGDGTSEVASRVGCSPGRISQIRRELEGHWREFHE